MSVQSLTLPTVLCDLGRCLSGADECPAVDEAITALDKVRLASLVGNHAALSTKPPLMGTDSMLPGDFFLYSDECAARIQSGAHNVHSVRGMHIVGGAMMHTTTVTFPVSVMVSNADGVLLLHSGDTPIAKLEAEFYDAAFNENDDWASHVLDQLPAQEAAEWRREAAVGVRRAGLRGTPAHLLGEASYRLLRHGVTPFLSLRAPENESEFSAVKNRLIEDLAVLPRGGRDLMKASLRHMAIRIGFVGSSDMQLPRNADIVVPGLDERWSSADSILATQPVLTWIASIILHNACDDTFETKSESVCEVGTGMRYKDSNQKPIDDATSIEMSFLERARRVTTTEIDKRESDHSGHITLWTVMKETQRLYESKTICDLTGTPAAAVMEAVSCAIFDADDALLVAESCTAGCTSSITSVTALSVLGKCLVDHQAIVIITRDSEGCISNAKLVGFERVVVRLSRDTLSRVLLFPWITVLLLDNDSVSMLLLKDPEHVRCPKFEREPLKLRNSATRRAGSVDRVSPQVVEEMRSDIAAIKKAVVSIKDIERKLDFLVEQKATHEPDASVSSGLCPALGSGGPLPWEPRYRPLTTLPEGGEVLQSLNPPEEDEVVQSLKRSLAAVCALSSKQLRNMAAKSV